MDKGEDVSPIWKESELDQKVEYTHTTNIGHNEGKLIHHSQRTTRSLLPVMKRSHGILVRYTDYNPRSMTSSHLVDVDSC